MVFSTLLTHSPSTINPFGFFHIYISDVITINNKKGVDCVVK